MAECPIGDRMKTQLTAWPIRAARHPRPPSRRRSQGVLQGRVRRAEL